MLAELLQAPTFLTAAVLLLIGACLHWWRGFEHEAALLGAGGAFLWLVTLFRYCSQFGFQSPLLEGVLLLQLFGPVLLYVVQKASGSKPISGKSGRGYYRGLAFWPLVVLALWLAGWVGPFELHFVLVVQCCAGIVFSGPEFTPARQLLLLCLLMFAQALYLAAGVFSLGMPNTFELGVVLALAWLPALYLAVDTKGGRPWTYSFWAGLLLLHAMIGALVLFLLVMALGLILLLVDAGCRRRRAGPRASF